MSKSKFGNSNLYMTTREFADLVVDALHEQNYFKYSDTAHPQDIAFAFTTVGETIGAAMNWAIKQEHDAVKDGKIKRGLNEPKDLKKVALPIDDEIAPHVGSQDDFLGYSEWRNEKGYL